MTPTQRAAAERLVEGPRTSGELWGRAVIALLRELLAEPGQEPVIAVVTTSHDYGATIDWTLNPLPTGTELFTHPPQQRKPLTREQIDSIWHAQGSFTDRESDYRIFARAIERAHGIGETPCRSSM